MDLWSPFCQSNSTSGPLLSLECCLYFPFLFCHQPLASLCSSGKSRVEPGQRQSYGSLGIENFKSSESRIVVWERPRGQGGMKPLTSSLVGLLKSGRIMIEGKKFSGKDHRCLTVCFLLRVFIFCCCLTKRAFPDGVGGGSMRTSLKSVPLTPIHILFYSLRSFQRVKKHRGSDMPQRPWEVDSLGQRSWI